MNILYKFCKSIFPPCRRNGFINFYYQYVACKPIINYSTEPLHGKGGTAEGWVFTDGTINIHGGVTIKGTLANRTIIFTVSPLQIGEVKLGNIFDLKTITYNDGTTNYIFSKGKYEITEISSNIVKGSMYIYNDTMVFNGTFELARTSY